MIRPEDLFDLSDETVAILFADCEMVWQALANIETHVKRLVGDKQTIKGLVMEGAHISNKPIYIEEGALIEPGAFIQGPAFIGKGAVVRHGAYVRDNVIMFSGSLIGHASEAKNSILLPNSLAPHFSYIGDSILGHHVNLGAGTKLSNLTMMSKKDPLTKRRPSLKIRIHDVEYDTGLSKFGAILGDEVQTGCNTVLNPGCLIGARTIVYANISLRKGYYPPDTIIKLHQQVKCVERI